MIKEYVGGLDFVKRLPNGELVGRPQVMELRYLDAMSPEIIDGTFFHIEAESVREARKKYLDQLPAHLELLGKPRMRMMKAGRMVFI